MSDNEHSTASLGNSEVLRIKHPVGPPIPEFCQDIEDDSHISSAARMEESWDILDKDPARRKRLDDFTELKE